MIVAIQGTKTFKDYSVFLRGMGTAMYKMDSEDKELTIFSAGPYQVNAMGLEFTNVSERSLKARGIKIKFVKIPPKWIEENINQINYFAFFSNQKEPVSNQVKVAEAKDIDVDVYRY